MGRAKHWTEEEIEYLCEKWGTVSINGIANHLGRSIGAVQLKAHKLGLSDARFSYDGITLNQLAIALNRSYSVLKNWIKSYDFPARKKVFCKEAKVWVVKYEDFWDWAEEHKSLLDFARLEPNLLGPEPEWVKEKRKADIIKINKSTQWKDWTEEEDKKLISLVSAYRYTYPEISAMMGRSCGSIKRRLYDLGIKARPVRLNNHIKWTMEEVKLLIDMSEKGYGYNTIAEKLGKSEHAVRGKLERMGFDFKRRRLTNPEHYLIFQEV
jgi:hypothetical protein